MTYTIACALEYLRYYAFENTNAFDSGEAFETFVCSWVHISLSEVNMVIDRKQ